MTHIDIVFTEMPDGGKDFIEIEDHTGASIQLGEWVKRDDGYSVIRFSEVDMERQRQIAIGYTTEHDDAQGIEHLIFEAGNRVASKPWNEVTREDLIQGAALLKAAAEVLDRAKS